MSKPPLLELILLFSAMTTAAQTPPGLPFNVYGYVLDETGAPVADAYVAVNSTVDQKTTRTDSLGRYATTISIRGPGDTLTVFAQIREASGTNSSIVPKGSPNLMINVTIPLRSIESTTETTPYTPTEAGPWSLFLPIAFVVVVLAALILAARWILSKR